MTDIPETGAAPQVAPPPQRPAHIPEKFWDPEQGAPRVEALARSYVELERKLGGMVRLPGADAAADEMTAFHRALGVPAAPEDYAIATKSEAISADPEVNARLHAAGFTPAQAQLVYDLAAERLAPMIEAMAAEFEGERQEARLIEHFGGEAPWADASRQIAAWAERHLPPDAYAALSTSADGILALKRMMDSGEPALGGSGSGGAEPAGEAELKAMMRDRRYWKDRDPAFTAKVTEGFRRLYG